MQQMIEVRRRTKKLDLKGMVAGWVSLALTILSGGTSAWSVNYYLAVDEPTVLGATRFMPREVVRSESAVYFLETALPPPTEFAGLHRQPDGSWLFSPSHPVELGGVRFLPRDVVAWDGAAAFAFLIDGGAEGLPPNARIDALFIDGASGRLILSFDVPVTIGGVRYGRSDLVQRVAAGVFELFWDSAVAGVPARTNVVGADQEGCTLNLLITFDIPTEIGAARFLPGELVKWDGVAFGSYFVDAAWPRSAQLRDFSLITDADGDGVSDCADCNDMDAGAFAAPGNVEGLDVSDILGGYQFTWSSQAATAGPGTAYDVYSGLVSSLSGTGDFSSGACLAENLAAASFDYLGADPPVGDAYYFMFRAQNSCATGSYGTAARDAGAALSAGPCL